MGHRIGLRAAAMRKCKSNPVQMKIGVLMDGTKLARWQAQGLRNVADDAEFVIYSCTNSRRRPRRVRNAFYYALNLFAIRNPLTRRIDLPDALPVLVRREFQ